MLDHQNNYVGRSNWLLECFFCNIHHYAWVSYILFWWFNVNSRSI